MALPRYYHLRDPIEHLVVHVTLRKVTEGDASRAGRTTRDEWTRSFQWQEKVFSPAEFRRFNTRAAGDVVVQSAKAASALEVEYKHTIAQRQEANEEILDVTADAVLYSYTDRDNYVPSSETTRAISTSTEPLSDMAMAAIALQRHAPSTHVATREVAFTTMYLMASLDIPSDLYKRKKKLNQIRDLDDHVLCELRYYPRARLLVCRPGFSRETQGATDFVCLEPSSLQSKRGSHYEYILVNAQNLHPDDSYTQLQVARELDRLQAAADDRARKAFEARCGFAGVAEPSSSIVSYVDVVATTLLTRDDEGLLLGRPRYLQYVVFLDKTDGTWVGPPETWDPIDARFVLQSGCTQQCLPRNGLLHWSLPLQVTVTLAALHETVPRHGCAYAWERHYVEGYGSVCLPTMPGRYDAISIELWRPRLPSVAAERRNFFLGGEGQLQSLFDVHKASFGLETDSAGSVLLRASVLHQSNVVDVITESKELRIIKRGVDEILAKVRAAKPGRTDRKVSAVSSILDQLREKRLLPAT
ncbi:hypothetical protein SPRG_04673 [Saprolegnia parasitica CBS 223.65]|uniref:Meckel syndrome type 1 protein n=1 Tax=Saprolegnia parasitica (strain CBS 223.65) TaxID=695850 RepID=A0A067CVF7_SAPPC|nr:hypothetical protein SPRG_04673 [Saprolegnia parasitica CBS 223.65]KDO30772.1 hypothetical protein SPRG_04673 [Saprolegnia parasitica CBS 223.65]|eukprot:XP_012198470.1 hypothetical protein SPRG_04673 [Saprolegnia parasitica CBS 223.65]